MLCQCCESKSEQYNQLYLVDSCGQIIESDESKIPSKLDLNIKQFILCLSCYDTISNNEIEVVTRIAQMKEGLRIVKDLKFDKDSEINNKNLGRYITAYHFGELGEFYRESLEKILNNNNLNTTKEMINLLALGCYIDLSYEEYLRSESACIGSEELGPYGGAFRDEDDYWHYKEGKYFY